MSEEFLLEDDNLEELAEIMDTGVAVLECGCTVEPDGICPCGNESPLLKWGLI